MPSWFVGLLRCLRLFWFLDRFVRLLWFLDYLWLECTNCVAGWDRRILAISPPTGGARGRPIDWWWVDKHWLVLLTPESGALEIPPGCLHRSYSGKEGSLLLNHAIRDDQYDENNEFHPVMTDVVGHYPTNYYGINFYDALNFIETGELP